MSEPESGSDSFVRWFRSSSPYIHAHRGRTFVVCLGGEAVAAPEFPHLVQDLALLQGLGIRLVLVYGARPQIESRLRGRGLGIQYREGLRITSPEAMECVKEAVGVVRIEIEALFSMGLANSPMAGVRIRVDSGNFVMARPLGVRGGVDHGHTGCVRRIDAAALRERLDEGALVLLPPLGYSLTGEVFNLGARDLAAATAVALGADKLIYLMEAGEPRRDSRPLSNLTTREADRLLGEGGVPAATARHLEAGIRACRSGVARVHLLDRRRDGALLRELFTPDGQGTLLTAEPFEHLRTARIDDVGGILELIAPLEAEGVLVRRSRERLEMEIERFLVLERDGAILACAALYPYPETAMGELACLAVDPAYRGSGRGDRLLAEVEARARAAGLERLFVLTTQTAHWFRERGFEPARPGDLPVARQALYNWQRNSKVFIKDLGVRP